MNVVCPKLFHGPMMVDDVFDQRFHHMSFCPPSCLLTLFLTFASCLDLSDLPLLLLVQPLQLGGLEDPRVHLEHPHTRLCLRAQHHQHQHQAHSAGAWCSLTTGASSWCGCAVEAGSRCWLLSRDATPAAESSSSPHPQMDEPATSPPASWPIAESFSELMDSQKAQLFTFLVML